MTTKTATKPAMFRLTAADRKNIEVIQRMLAGSGYGATATAAIRYALARVADRKEVA